MILITTAIAFFFFAFSKYGCANKKYAIPINFYNQTMCNKLLFAIRREIAGDD